MIGRGQLLVIGLGIIALILFGFLSSCGLARGSQVTTPVDPMTGDFDDGIKTPKLTAAQLPILESTSTPLTIISTGTPTIVPTAWAYQDGHILPKPLYYLSNLSGNQQVWRIEVDGYTMTQISQFDEPVFSYDVCPVTNLLAMLSGDYLWITDMDGSEQRRISVKAQFTSQKVVAHNAFIDCSPDGKILAIGGWDGLWLYHLDQSNWQQIIPRSRENSVIWVDPRWTWSPDQTGLLLKILHTEAEARVAYYDIVHREWIVPQDLTVGYRFSWSEEGDYVYASANYTNSDWIRAPGLLRWEIDGNQTVALIGHKILRINSLVDYVAGAQSSPDGSLYYFYGGAVYTGTLYSDSTAMTQMYQTDLNGQGEPRPLRQDRYSNLDEVLWSPDMRLAIAKQCEDITCNTGRLLLLTNDNKPALELVTDGGGMKWGN